MNTPLLIDKPKVRTGISREKMIPTTLREIRIALTEIVAKSAAKYGRSR